MLTDVHILVVEDDEDINRLLCDIVKKNGYRPQPAYSGTEALLHLERQSWDLVMLDLMLPGMTGVALLEQIRNDSDTPVIILSAKLEQQTKISALRAGADDYITKPFDIEEVSARINARLRRYLRKGEPSAISRLIFRDITVDTEARCVLVSGIELSLTAREYAILVLLLSSPKKVFTKANMFESVWQEAYYGDDNIINVHMSNLRSKLAKANPLEEYIETVWGMGYRLKT
jgi:DNA-binding response OmpR family regulator